VDETLKGQTTRSRTNSACRTRRSTSNICNASCLAARGDFQIVAQDLEQAGPMIICARRFSLRRLCACSTDRELAEPILQMPVRSGSHLQSTVSA